MIQISKAESMASERQRKCWYFNYSYFGFFLFSLVGYNPNEEPSISPNVKVENPMGILGVAIAHVFIKIGFGYIAILLPFIGFLWGWSLFAKKDLANISRLSNAA